MHMLYRGRPLQGIGAPRVLRRLGTAPHGVEEIEDENQLCNSAKDGEHGDDDIDILQLVEDGELRIAIVAAGKAS